MTAEHERYMRRCLALAQHRRFLVRPNPAVGCVIVHEDRIIGEGVTQAPGGRHAEVQALNTVQDKHLLPLSTLYVTLEPCNHFGRTPPCSHAIVAAGIKKVVVAVQDPFPEVNGGGIATLESAGIEVIYGVLEEETRSFHKRFITFHAQKRPFIILKWAQTQNGFIAPETGKQKWITGDIAKQYSHRLRAQEDCIMVGTSTALADNPQLNARLWETNQQPLRLVWDNQLTLPEDLHLLNGSQPTWVLNELHEQEKTNLKYVRIVGENKLEQLFARLYAENIQSIIVEGGKKTLQTFIAQNYWDEVHRIIGAVHWESGITAPLFRGFLREEKKLGNDKLEIWQA